MKPLQKLLQQHGPWSELIKHNDTVHFSRCLVRNGLLRFPSGVCPDEGYGNPQPDFHRPRSQEMICFTSWCEKRTSRTRSEWTAGHVSDRDITVLSCVCEECITGNWLLSQLFISYHTANSLFAFYNKNGKSVSIAKWIVQNKGMDYYSLLMLWITRWTEEHGWCICWMLSQWNSQLYVCENCTFMDFSF